MTDTTPTASTIAYLDVALAALYRARSTESPESRRPDGVRVPDDGWSRVVAAADRAKADIAAAHDRPWWWRLRFRWQR